MSGWCEKEGDFGPSDADFPASYTNRQLVCLADSCDGVKRETGSWQVEFAGRLRNHWRVRVRRESAYYAGVSGRRVKPRAERLAPRSFGHPDFSVLCSNECRNRIAVGRSPVERYRWRSQLVDLAFDHRDVIVNSGSDRLAFLFDFLSEYLDG